MSELEAIKSEVETPGAKEAASPTAEPKTDTSVKTDSQVGGAKPESVQSPESLPFHKHPDFTRTVKEVQDLKKRNSELERRYLETLEKIARQKEEGPTIDPEQEEAVLKLADFMFANPKVRQKYGLDGVKQLEEKLSSVIQSRTEETFDTELNSVANEFSSEYGYKPDELKDEIQNFIAEDEWFSHMPATKGSVRKAAKLFFAEKAGELAERKARMKLIKEQEDKKKGNSESTSGQPKGAEKTLEPTMAQFIRRRIREEGGIEF